ncbi:DUF1311 domain-containing protein [Rhodobacteraceae bacterium F11138]|nr:DUF1311 domain-containing protein [Rhodobacteraceae bacterium F11138]
MKRFNETFSFSRAGRLSRRRERAAEAGAVFAVLCTAPIPSAAQDLVFSIEITAACIAAAPDMPAKRACIGNAADACMQATPAGDTTVGMGGCLDRERAYWDAMLNANYQTARAQAKAADAEMQEIGATVPSMDAALRDMQRNWIGYRDATCDYERSLWSNGTGAGPATLSCLMRLTGEQALYLGDAGLAN